jgi:diguanylate cyclase (GGDEF)-like protein
MFRVLNCLTVEHDLRLVALAAAMCVMATFTAFSIYSQAVDNSGLKRLGWLFLTGVTAACGIWATHFIAMLAYDPGLPVGYDPALTIASLLIAVPATSIGFGIATQGRPWQWAVGGAVIGLGISLMHYTGMRSVLLPGAFHWDSTLVAASLVIGAALSSAAVVAYHRLEPPRATWMGTGLLTLAICGMHFTAMGAATAIADPTVPFQASPVESDLIAAAVAGVAVIILLAGATPALIASQTAREAVADKIRFQAALDNMSQGLCMVDADGRIQVCNKRYATMYGLPPELARPGTNLRDVSRYRLATGCYYVGVNAEDIKDDRVKPAMMLNVTRELTDGRIVSVSRRPLPDGGWVTTHQDVTELRRIEARVQHLAHHDSLTDLPNRVLLRERLKQAAAGTRHGDRNWAVLVLDLDRFKEVNDTLGHGFGDALLKAVAERLRACVRDTDTVARLGGDEFVILQRVSEPAAEAEALAKRIIEAINTPFDLDGQNVSVGTSIGIALASPELADSDRLLNAADLALYHTKSAERGTYHFYEPEMDQQMQSRRTLERDLRLALANGEFELYYQPLVNLERDEICGFEALLRWNHPRRGLLCPADFIALAEETGLIVPIGEWVLRRACAEAARWPEHLKVSVNVSVVQFKAQNLVSSVVSALAAGGLAPCRLELEVTESVVLEDSETAFTTLNQLHDLGVRIALDDFGTGYSSLTNLRRFPFDKIKIDRSFVSDLSAANVNALAIVRSVARLGVSLGMATTAEGVETKEQVDQVRAEGCTEMQGYYICRPSPANEIAKLIETRVKGKAASAA